MEARKPEAKMPAQPRKKGIDDVMKEMQVTPAEAAELDGAPRSPEQVAEDEEQQLDGEFEQQQLDEAEEAGTEPKSADAIPDWVIMPKDLRIPPGRTVAFIRLRAEWTDHPSKGDRQCIIWNLTHQDEKFAMARTRGEVLRTLPELTKQMIRAVDGVKVDWSGRGKAGSVEKFFDEIGTKGRSLLQNYYAKTHSLTTLEKIDFFANCIAVRSAAD